MSIGSRIHTARTRLDVSQAKLGELVGVSEKTIRRYESDENPPLVATLDKLASILGVTTDYLIRGDEHADPERVAS